MVGFPHPSTGSLGVLSVPRTSPVVPAPAECLLLNAADTNQAQLEAGPSFTGDPAGCLFPAVPLTPRPATTSHHGGESDDKIEHDWGALGSPGPVS